MDAKTNGALPANAFNENGPEGYYTTHYGLTKRELFAAMERVPDDLSMSWGELMVGPCPCRDERGEHVFDEAVIRWWAAVYARYRVIHADALLAALTPESAP